MNIPFNFAHLQAAFRLIKVLEGSKTNTGGKTPQITVTPSAEFLSVSSFIKNSKWEVIVFKLHRRIRDLIVLFC